MPICGINIGIIICVDLESWRHLGKNQRFLRPFNCHMIIVLEMISGSLGSTIYLHLVEMKFEP